MPLELKRTERHFIEAAFTDDSGVEWYVGQSDLTAIADLLYIGENSGRIAQMCLTRQMVADLLPLLERFAETGRLAEETGS